MNLHSSTVWRVCKSYFISDYDAQDAFQDTFLKFALADASSFKDDAHQKAWLIIVASNICKDMLRAYERKNTVLDFSDASQEPLSIDYMSQPDSAHREVLDAFRQLDDPPRLPLYLALYEGYTAPEIAEMLDVPVSTVYSWISRGKKTLKEALS